MKLLHKIIDSVLFASVLYLSIVLLTTCDSPETENQEGQAIFWTSGNYDSSRPTIYLEDQSIGVVETLYDTAPTCTASGCVIIKRAPGTYNWRAVWTQGGIRTGTVTVTSGGCTAIKVYYKGA